MLRVRVLAMLLTYAPFSLSAAEVIGSGTGFGVSPGGHILTNAHVVSGCSDVTARIGGVELQAQVVSIDSQNDLALLQISRTFSTVLPLREGTRVQLGEAVVAFGYPLQGVISTSLNMTTGNISALAGLGDDARSLQFTAPIQPGSSGGPLVDGSGNVVGVVTSKLSPLWAAKNIGDVPQNVNFALKVSVIREFLESRSVEYHTGGLIATTAVTELPGKVSGAIFPLQCIATPKAKDIKANTVNCGRNPSRQGFAAGVCAYQEKDYATAAKEWTPLAQNGDSAAQFNLGLMYMDGTGVPQDRQKAILWWRRSADQGYAKAQGNLGNLYAVGNGVKRDYVTAHMWLNLCAASGDEKCAAQRDLLAKKMKKRDLSEAQKRASSWHATPEPGK